jgi:Peptidase family M28
MVGTNLIGVRPRARVALWLVAHYDSKGQPLSMALRICAVVLAVFGLGGLLEIAAVRAIGDPWSRVAEVLLAFPALVGGLLLLGNRVTNDSPGAVDNASALVTVCAILDLLPAGAPVGVLFPDAEEYGLLGARALVRDRANLFEGAAVLNLDGIDDRGSTICFVHRPGPAVAAVATALDARQRRFLPVVVDGLAFGRVARECATIVRGDWRTASIVHTPLDVADRLTLEGSGAVAARMAHALGGMVAR